MSWDAVTAKFDRLAGRHVDAAVRTQIIKTVRRLDDLAIAEFVRLLMTPRAVSSGAI